MSRQEIDAAFPSKVCVVWQKFNPFFTNGHREKNLQPQMGWRFVFYSLVRRSLRMACSLRKPVSASPGNMAGVPVCGRHRGRCRRPPARTPARIHRTACTRFIAVAGLLHTTQTFGGHIGATAQCTQQWRHSFLPIAVHMPLSRLRVLLLPGRDTVTQVRPDP